MELAEVVHPDDIGVVESGRGLRLQAESLGVRRLSGTQQFDRHRAPEDLVGSPSHLAHRAASQQLLHLIAVRQQTLHTHPDHHDARTSPSPRP
ncbi:hypothetical protein GCM10010350_76660 [Streptomyces galilaeus]|nr:hypothetical protein GCM10010350_76660 [Streptomyces galilaeus]